MTKHARIAAVGAAAGALAAALALATSRGWVSGSWSEALLMLGIVVVLFALMWLVGDAVIAALVALAGVLVAPEPPPGLVRIARIMAQVDAESNPSRRPPDTSP